jgi:hypothetical protein
MSDITDTLPQRMERAKITDHAQWVVADGPVGRGKCLLHEESPDAAVFIVPAGMPLQLPELGESLRHWRHGRVRDGRLEGEPTICTVQEAIDIAPANRDWIERQVREQDRRERVTAEHERAKPDEDRFDLPLVAALIADRRPIPSLTQSASRFAEIVHGLPEDSAMSQVERLVAGATSAAHLAGELDTVAFSIGRPATRQLVASLLHARSRSHSWRYTQLFAALQRTDPAEQKLSRHIAAATSAQELLQRLGSLEQHEQELDDILIDLLYARSKSARWRATYPLRRLGGLPRLRGVRRLLRRAQPTYASIKQQGRRPRGLKPHPGG